MNKSTIRKMSDRKRPVISVDENEETIVMLMLISQSCKAVGWTQAEVNDAMSYIILDGYDKFIDSLEECLE